MGDILFSITIPLLALLIGYLVAWKITRPLMLQQKRYEAVVRQTREKFRARPELEPSEFAERYFEGDQKRIAEGFAEILKDEGCLEPDIVARMQPSDLIISMGVADGGEVDDIVEEIERRFDITFDADAEKAKAVGETIEYIDRRIRARTHVALPVS